MEEAEQLYWKSEKKCEELKEELTAVHVQIQLSEIQGFTDKQKSFCSLSLTKKQVQVKKLLLSLNKHYENE